MADEIRHKMSKFRSLLSFEEAARLIHDERWYVPATEALPVQDCMGRILASDVRALRPYPSANRSLVDGYAVASSALSGCSPSDPVRLPVSGLSAAGSPEGGKFDPTQCVEIYTGSLMPAGTDAVVPAEDAVRRMGFIEVFSPIKAGSNVAFMGEDLQQGQTLARAGERISQWHIGGFLASGISQVTVYSRIEIAIIPTGNELFPESPDYIANSTSHVIGSMIHGGWSSIIQVPPVHDTVEDVADAVSRHSTSGIIIITGGSSLGGRDNVPEAMKTLDSRVIFGGVRTRPGRTTALYSLHSKPVISVSGFPYAGSIMADIILELILGKTIGFRSFRNTIALPLGIDLTVKAGYTSFIPGKVERREEGSVVIPVLGGRGKRMSSLIQSHGLIVIPEGKEGLKAGEPVEFRQW